MLSTTYVRNLPIPPPGHIKNFSSLVCVIRHLDIIKFSCCEWRAEIHILDDCLVLTMGQARSTYGRRGKLRAVLRWGNLRERDNL
jgi:hypothetical protein